MTALTADVIRTTRNADLARAQIANAVTIFQGAYVCLLNGRIKIFADEAGEVPYGVAMISGVGDTSAAIPPTSYVYATPQIIESIPVTGASAIGDVEQPVYLTDADDNLLTLTRPSTADVIPFGHILNFKSATSFDVLTVPLSQRLTIPTTAAYTITNPNTLRIFDATTGVLDDAVGVLGTLLADLQGKGLIG